jgi:UTP--glucose-1-phosphate uridylyltransferase
VIGNEPFAVILPDDMVLAERSCIAQMVKDYKGGNMAAVMDVPREKTKSYGILDIKEADGKMVTAKGLVEKPDPKDAPSTLSIIGRYILDPGIFTALENQAKGSGGEIQLTDAMSKMISNVPFYGYRFDGKRYDCGDKVGYIEANIAYALQQDELKTQINDILKHFVKG